EVQEGDHAPLMDGGALIRWTALFGTISSAAAIATLSALEATKVYRKDSTFPWMAETLKIVNPHSIGDGLALVGGIAGGLVLGLTLAAIWLTRGRGRAPA
ncbi:MAG TPA: hypothetical protein PKU70_09400, partial [Vicinamibacteria bacterium]|nr:hypothetical protein [Vicinamibacteria bacterium]